MNDRERWSPEDDARLRKMLEEGLSFDQISERIAGRKRDNIKRRVYRLGLSAVNCLAWDEAESALLKLMVGRGATMAELVEAFPGRTRRAIAHRAIRMNLRPKQAPREWTAAELDTITTMYEGGASIRQIAPEVRGRSRRAIGEKLERLGVVRGKPPTLPKVEVPKATPRHVRKVPCGRVFANHGPAPTRDQLYAMLADAVRNTAAMQEEA